MMLLLIDLCDLMYSVQRKTTNNNKSARVLRDVIYSVQKGEYRLLVCFILGA